MPQTQISAYISDDIKAELEIYVKQHGVKKAHVIEDALLHHLQALRDIPQDAVIPARLVLSKSAIENLVEHMTGTDGPAQKLEALLKD